MGVARVVEPEADVTEDMLEVALGEFRSNPRIDERIRGNRVIMRELNAAVREVLPDSRGSHG
jgi:hypothetical protein